MANSSPVFGLFARLLLIEVEMLIKELDGGIARKLSKLGRASGHYGLKYGSDEAIHPAWNERLQSKSNRAEK